MPITTSSVFHFTDSLQHLQGILKQGFKVHCCKEKIRGVMKDDAYMAFPMVSFCDIPLSEVKEHINSYGEYAVGLTKEWAARKHLNPVLYLEHDSTLTKSLKFVLRKIVDDNKVDGDQ